MTQHGLVDLDPTKRSGSDLQLLFEALHSNHKGPARPAYAVAGMLWANSVSPTQTDLMFFDGTTDFLVLRVDPESGLLDAAAARNNIGLSNDASGRAKLGALGAADLAPLIERLDNDVGVVLTGGTANVQTLAAQNTITAYAALQSFSLRVGVTNTGAVTLNVDGKGAKPVEKYDSAGALVGLAAGDWRLGQIHRVIYDGTRFILVSTLIDLATQAEAEAGTDNRKLMTPLRAAEAIVALTPAPALPLALLQTIQLSGESTVEFSAFDNVLYRGYEFEFTTVIPGTDNVHLRCRLSADGGASFAAGASDYSFHVGSMTGAADAGSAGVTYYGGTRDGADSSITLAQNIGSAANEAGLNTLVRMPEPESNAVRSHVWADGAYTSTSTNVMSFHSNGMRRVNTAINAIQFYFSGGVFESGEIRIYGKVR
jgi:hypothetical protein